MFIFSKKQEMCVCVCIYIYIYINKSYIGRVALSLWLYYELCIYIYVCLYNKFSHVYNTWFETWYAWMCMYACLDGDVPQWIFQFHVVFSFAHRRFHPSTSSFAPVRSKPRSASFNFRSMCGMFVYGCDLLALREDTARASLLHYRGGGSESGRRGGVGEICRFQTLRAWWIRRYTAAVSDVSWTVLEASRNATGRGR